MSRSDTICDTYDVMYKKEQSTCSGEQSVVCFAGYSGSAEAAQVSKTNGDLEFGAALNVLGASAVTYLLWKEQSADLASTEEVVPALRQLENTDHSSQSDSETLCMDAPECRQPSGQKDPTDCDGEFSIPVVKKRRRAQSLDDDDDDFLDA